MIRKIKWIFAEGTESELKNTCLVIFNRFVLSKVLFKRKGIRVDGLGLYKTERQIFSIKPFEFRGVLNIYINNLLISYNRDGYKKHLKNVSILDNIKII